MSKPQTVNPVHKVPPKSRQWSGFSVHVHGPITARLFDLIYAYSDVRIVDVDGAGAFLAPESALDLADRIAGDEQLRTLILDDPGGDAA